MTPATEVIPEVGQAIEEWLGTTYKDYKDNIDKIQDDSEEEEEEEEIDIEWEETD